MLVAAALATRCEDMAKACRLRPQELVGNSCLGALDHHRVGALAGLLGDDQARLILGLGDVAELVLSGFRTAGGDQNGRAVSAIGANLFARIMTFPSFSLIR
jgi:hypothetical protein